MSLYHHALAALQQLPASPSAQTVTVSSGADRLVCDLIAWESLGCSFERLSIETDQLAGASVERLQQIGSTLSARLTYLLEPIRPIEVDAEHCIVQLRSSPPQKGESSNSYYELLARRGGEISLCRYETDPATGRKVVPASVTREVLFRLIQDLSSVC